MSPIKSKLRQRYTTKMYVMTFEADIRTPGLNLVLNNRSPLHRFNFRQRHLLDSILWIWHWPFKMIIRAKHTCESDLRAFCTKMHLKHLLHKQPTPKSYSYIILKFPPIPTLYSACLETLFWVFWGNMFCKSAPSWQTQSTRRQVWGIHLLFPMFLVLKIIS